MAENFLTRQEVAELLGVTVHTIDNYRRLHGLPYIKIANTVRFVLQDVLEWIKSYNGAQPLTNSNNP